MKFKFPIIFKVLLLGTAVALLASTFSVVFSYYNLLNNSKAKLIESLDNSLDSFKYLFGTGEEAGSNVTDLIEVKKYVLDNYEPVRDKTINDYDTFEEYEEEFKNHFFYIFPPKNAVIGSQEFLHFSSIYTQLKYTLVENELASGGTAAYIAYEDEDLGRLIFLCDSRMQHRDDNEVFYHLPGSHYDIKDGDELMDDSAGRYQGYYLNGYTTKFYPITDAINGTNEVIAYYFIEYDTKVIEQQVLETINKEIIIVSISAAAMILIYTLVAYFFFVKNINKLSTKANKISYKLKHNEELVPESYEIKGHDEIKILGDSIVLMEKELINYVDIIKKEASEKERANAELSVASKIQLEALPDKFYIDDKLILEAFIKPAKEVGGDFYDYFYLDEDRLAFVISDVSGKGVPAALFMMKSKELIKSKLISGLGLKEAIKEANNELVKNNEENLFVTSFIGIINFKTNEMHYINAGHERPYIIRNKEIIKLDGICNFVLGGLKDLEYLDESCEFKKGDSIFLFTDGLNESINVSKEEFNYPRIEEILKKQLNNNLINVMNDNLAKFVGEEEQFDDITELLITFNKDLHLQYNQKDYSIIEDSIDKIFNYYNNLSPDVLSKIGIIIDELLNNLISYEKRDDLTINIDFISHENDIQIRISCNGGDYDITKNLNNKYITKYSDNITPGGFGIKLMKEFSKELKYEYKDNCSIVTITLEI